MKFDDTVDKIEEILSRTQEWADEVLRDANLAALSTMRVGGTAALLLAPASAATLIVALNTIRATGLPYFVLGRGSNVVFPDGRFERVILSTAKIRGETFCTEEQGSVFVHADAGCPTDDVVNYCVNRGLGGLESFAGLPGTIGGAVYMNARCYDRQMSDVLARVEYVEETDIVTKNIAAPEWGYKKSPFQGLAGSVITGAWFQVTALSEGEGPEVQKKAEGYRRDRTEKGHFRLPSCGSAFKNNRAFGAPTGKIIDELGLRGCAIGGAQIAPWHGNIIVNTGGATAKDMEELMKLVEKRVFEARGFRLEREIVVLHQQFAF